MNAIRRNFLYSRVQRVSRRASTQPPPHTAVLLLNMGGPHRTADVHDYLVNIMTDTDMIQLPLQSILGPLIARRRTKEVQGKYEEIGGGSPIHQWTDLQGQLLCHRLDELSPTTAPHRHYVAFRYVQPSTEDALDSIHRDGARRVVIFSQYPHYSCATSGSSFNAIFRYYRDRPLPSHMEWRVIDRWPTHPMLVQCVASRIREQLDEIDGSRRDKTMLLFSAHSLPLKAVSRGDPYPFEVAATVQAVMAELSHTNPYSLVWQSKVGPLPWLEPATDEAIRGLVRQGHRDFILIPIAFVNEHIETLHEMDIEYCKDLAAELGPEVSLRRAAAPNDHPLLVAALSQLVLHHGTSEAPAVSPQFLTRCPGCTNSRCESTKGWFARLCGLRA